MKSPAARPLLVAIAVLGALALAGCAAKAPVGAVPPEADQAFAAFIAQAKAGTMRPFAVQTSLNLSGGGKSIRLLLNMRGDANTPIRLDFASSMGVTFAMWREDMGGWTAYYPASQAAYTHPDAKTGARALGMPLPFSLRELAALLTGRYGELAPAGFAKVLPCPGGFIYSLSGDPRLSAISLDPLGRPIGLTGKGLEPWKVEFSEFDGADGASLPQTITLTTSGGVKAVLRVKKRELRDAPWPPGSLDLALPDRTVIYALDVTRDVKRPDLTGGQ